MDSLLYRANQVIAELESQEKETQSICSELSTAGEMGELARAEELLATMREKLGKAQEIRDDVKETLEEINEAVMEGDGFKVDSLHTDIYLLDQEIKALES